MTYRITSYEVLQANISASNSTIMLCRANLGRIDMTDEERADLIWRIERQRAELEGMVLELHLGTHRRRSPAQQKTRSVVDFRAG